LIAVGAPSLCRLHIVDLVVYLVRLEGRAEGGGDCAGDPEAFVAVVEDVEECEGRVVRDGGAGGGVYQVPCGADVGVGDGEGLVEGC
jgi:hypothetical protein